MGIQSWLNPLDRMIIAKAVKAGRKEATLKDGRIVTISEYFAREPRRLVIRIRGQLIPMALVKRERVLSPDWVGIDP